MTHERMILTLLLLPTAEIRPYCQPWNITGFAVFDSVLREDFNLTSDSDVLLVPDEPDHPTLY